MINLYGDQWAVDYVISKGWQRISHEDVIKNMLYGLLQQYGFDADDIYNMLYIKTDTKIAPFNASTKVLVAELLAWGVKHNPAIWTTLMRNLGGNVIVVNPPKAKGVTLRQGVDFNTEVELDAKLCALGN